MRAGHIVDILIHLYRFVKAAIKAGTIVEARIVKIPLPVCSFDRICLFFKRDVFVFAKCLTSFCEFFNLLLTFANFFLSSLKVFSKRF